MPIGGWTHLVFTWDRTTSPQNSASFYVDGTRQGGNSFAPDGLKVIQHFELYNGFGGSYDDLTFWKRAFSEEEIRQIP